ncbi:MAG TPA: GspH/FimT family pseudopilin [Terriglobales bacterium]|nr:GspH/FimT family pseudopilin [Terriglobales bacterium]
MTELLVTVAMIGILSVLGTPFVVTYVRSAALRGGAQELATLLNGARALAIARNTNVCMRLTGTSAEYRTATSATCGGGALYIGPGTAADGSMSLGNHMEISGTTANVTFSNLGAALTAGTYTVRHPQTGNTLTVVVSAAGRVQIQ